MSDDPMLRFELVVEEGLPRGDLYELERRTRFHVVDRHTGVVVMSFSGEMEASLSRETGMWDDYQLAGVCEVTLAANGQSVTVKYHDGHEETVPLPRV